MTQQAKRVTVTYDVVGECVLTDEDAVNALTSAIEDGEVLNYFVQGLPDLGYGRWVEQ